MNGLKLKKRVNDYYTLIDRKRRKALPTLEHNDPKVFIPTKIVFRVKPSQRKPVPLNMYELEATQRELAKVSREMSRVEALIIRNSRFEGGKDIFTLQDEYRELDYDRKLLEAKIARLKPAQNIDQTTPES